MNTIQNQPIKPLRFTEQIFDISLHPSKYLLASGLLTGHLFIHRFGNDEPNLRIYRKKQYQKSCRAVSFSADGQGVYSASKDKSWSYLDLASQELTYSEPKAHDAPINKIISLNEQMVATGDDNGCVKLWDVRKKKQAFSYNEHVDYISSFSFNEPKRHLIATSGDGCLSVYDIRKPKSAAVSENQDDELTCSVVLKNGSKVAVGSQSGVVGIFSYGMFSDVTDRFPGNPSSIEHMCKISENCVVTAGGDGYLRVLNLFPHNYSRVLGQHGALPLEKIVTTFDKDYLISCGQDSKVRFWDIKNLVKSQASKNADKINFGKSDSSGDSEGSDSFDDSDGSDTSAKPSRKPAPKNETKKKPMNPGPPKKAKLQTKNKPGEFLPDNIKAKLQQLLASKAKPKAKIRTNSDSDAGSGSDSGSGSGSGSDSGSGSGSDSDSDADSDKGSKNKNKNKNNRGNGSDRKKGAKPATKKRGRGKKSFFSGL